MPSISLTTAPTCGETQSLTHISCFSDWTICVRGRDLDNGQLRKIKKNSLLHAFVHLILLWLWMVCSQLIRWLVVFVCNALTWYSSLPPFNLFGPKPTLNAQIASFQRDSSVSRAVLLRWAPEQTPGSLSPMPWKGGWTCGTGALKWPGTHQPLEVFYLKLFHSFTLLWMCAFNIKQARADV